MGELNTAVAEYDEKMIAAKGKLLERFRRRKRRSGTPELERLPPGQHKTKGFPVLDLGVRPKFYEPRWRFRVDGEVETPLELDWLAFSALPHSTQTSDFHCVTTWSKLDVVWGGVPFIDIATLAGVRDSARFVIAESADYYTTNLPVEDCLDDDVMLADQLFGEPLPQNHGGPLRLIVPKLYAWKSAKFLRRLTFSVADEPGYWEQRGYHNRGNPWEEERHG